MLITKNPVPAMVLLPGAFYVQRSKLVDLIQIKYVSLKIRNWISKFQSTIPVLFLYHIIPETRNKDL